MLYLNLKAIQFNQLQKGERRAVHERDIYFNTPGEKELLNKLEVGDDITFYKVARKNGKYQLSKEPGTIKRWVVFIERTFGLTPGIKVYLNDINLDLGK
jgi:hypothetical protein